MASETLTKGALPRIQWGPVITGVLCAIAVQIVLGLFGMAFGFASEPAGRGLGILAGIWGVVITPIAASFVGALVAVRIAGERLEAGSYLHGALVWCIGLIAGALFLTSVASSGAMSLGSAAAGMGPRRDVVIGRAQTRDDAARGAAAGAGAAAVGALLGLGGALLGAAVGRRTLTGEPLVRRRRVSGRTEVRDDYRTGSTAGYGSQPGTTDRPGEPPLHH